MVPGFKLVRILLFIYGYKLLYVFALTYPAAAFDDAVRALRAAAYASICATPPTRHPIIKIPKYLYITTMI